MTDSHYPNPDFPFTSEAYLEWCAERGIRPQDPDSADAFSDVFEFAVGYEGLCDHCLREARAVWEEVPGDWDFVGTDCCGEAAVLLDPRGEHIPARDLVRPGDEQATPGTMDDVIRIMGALDGRNDLTGALPASIVAVAETVKDLQAQLDLFRSDLTDLRELLSLDV